MKASKNKLPKPCVKNIPSEPLERLTNHLANTTSTKRVKKKKKKKKKELIISLMDKFSKNNNIISSCQ